MDDRIMSPRIADEPRDLSSNDDSSECRRNGVEALRAKLPWSDAASTAIAFYEWRIVILRLGTVTRFADENGHCTSNAEMYGDSRRPSRAISGTEWHGALLVALFLLVCPARVLRADDIYKSVDAQGHVVYSDRADRSSAPQTLVRIEGVPAPPRVLHFCWTNCATLTLENGRYVRTDGTDESWTIERFTPTSVVLRRHDVPAAWNGFSTDVTYQGQVSNEQLINVTVNGNAVPDIKVAWGAALDTLPGSNAERDQRLAQLKAHANESASAPTNVGAGADVEMRAAEAPPPLLIDQQPPCAEDGDIWTPGYWSWRTGYFWVGGMWVRPPRAGLLWTPGYWEYAGALYAFHAGYWGPHMGFYGGINYGFGYVGVGFAGGRWVGNSFVYNTTVSNVDTKIIHSTYSEAVVNAVTLNKVSYNGGPGGTAAVATMQEKAAAAEPHILPTALQRQITQQAVMNPALMARANESHAPVARAAVRAPRVAGTNSAGAPLGHVAPAPVTVEQPKRVPSAAPTTNPQSTPAQPASSKPAGATPTRPQQKGGSIK
jgi:hypothetical protein